MARRRTELLLLAALGAALLAAPGCSVSRTYKGSKIRAIPAEHLIPGKTTKSQVLRIFGPPDEIMPQHDGDLFAYRYGRKNTESFKVEEPIFTGLQLFKYSLSRQKRDSLVVLFDEEGVVRSFAFSNGTEELGL